MVLAFVRGTRPSRSNLSRLATEQTIRMMIQKAQSEGNMSEPPGRRIDANETTQDYGVVNDLKGSHENSFNRRICSDSALLI
jgi:hypothetical protein